MKQAIQFFITMLTLAISTFAFGEEIPSTQSPSFATLDDRRITIDNQTGQAFIISIPTMFGPIPYATNIQVVTELYSGEKIGDCANKDRVCYRIPEQYPFPIAFILDFKTTIPKPQPNEGLINIFNEAYSSSPSANVTQHPKGPTEPQHKGPTTKGQKSVPNSLYF